LHAQLHGLTIYYALTTSKKYNQHGGSFKGRADSEGALTSHFLMLNLGSVLCPICHQDLVQCSKKLFQHDLLALMSIVLPFGVFCRPLQDLILLLLLLSATSLITHWVKKAPEHWIYEWLGFHLKLISC